MGGRLVSSGLDLLTLMIAHQQLLSLSKLFMANTVPRSLIEDCLFLGGVFAPPHQIWETNGPEIVEETCQKTFVVEGEYLKMHFGEKSALRI